jgi:hypothetical protein
MNKLILISLVIFLAICSRSWAEDAVTIIDKGKILNHTSDKYGNVGYHIIYKKVFYYCSFNYNSKILACEKATNDKGIIE